tara:strand:- start:1023 stop:1253 length:231 start_codon:yes stop_codon:yes gene_type:complete
MRILHMEDGMLVVITPILTEINPETGNPYTIQEIAAKDVPTGAKYKVVEDSVVPEDRSFRDAWTIDESELTDGVGA